MAMNHDKSVKEKKPSKKLSVVFKQFWSDLKKITWPSGKTGVMLAAQSMLEEGLIQ